MCYKLLERKNVWNRLLGSSIVDMEISSPSPKRHMAFWDMAILVYIDTLHW